MYLAWTNRSTKHKSAKSESRKEKSAKALTTS